MVRFILLIIFVLFVIWILRPFFVTKNSGKTTDTVNRILNSDRSNYRQRNKNFTIIIVIIVVALSFWLLPKLGINIFALLQKIIPVISSLRGILPI